MPHEDSYARAQDKALAGSYQSAQQLLLSAERNCQRVPGSRLH